MAAGAAACGPALEVAGVRLAAVAAGVRYPDRPDVVLMELAPGSATAGVYTRNAFRAAPVVLAKRHGAKAAARYFLVNTGCANAGTGEAGLEAARRCCEAVAAAAGVEPEQVLPFSTGVIGEPLPVERVTAAAPRAFAALSGAAWEDAARGIMTTDTRPKLASRRVELPGGAVAVTGIAKGAGMLHPDMATMLAFVFTDARVERAELEALLAGAVEGSFHRITVDGDTSTNDCAMLAATGRSGVAAGVRDEAFRRTLEELFAELATGLVRDAEGATKFITIRVSGGRTRDECLKVAWAVAGSPLVKTAFFASDPNWGRILAAVGRAGVEALDIAGVSIRLGGTLVVGGGAPDAAYTEERGREALAGPDVRVDIGLGRGDRAETVWTSDLSDGYVRVNADYRS